MKCSDFRCSNEAEAGKSVRIGDTDYPLCGSCYPNWVAGLTAWQMERMKGGRVHYDPVEIKFEKGRLMIHVKAPREERKTA